MPELFHPGQRWVSESEPELGLGAILRTTSRTVTVVFGASGETREYARDGAPLRRVLFRVGDTIRDHAEDALVVQSVAERGALVFYRGDGREVSEAELSDTLSFSKPEQRLLAGQLDPTEVFDLRVAALEHQHRRRRSAVRGFVGGRIDLIPHQLYIASEVAGRLVPRVLLADEVGLGKTIEAGLILHRLILTGRAQRVLILVPDSLVHQWFVELLRRFNLWFHIFDEERCDAIETESPGANPFLEDQLVLASLRLFTSKDERWRQALAAGWDMLVVDEAHHLGWSPAAASPEYALVERLGRAIPGLLLLTATPEQLGMASHFARLRLLDPDRFHDLDLFIHEAEQYREVARLAERIRQNQTLAEGDVAILARTLTEPEARVRAKLGDPAERAELIGALLDRHGTGRVMFRNTRTTITGFPKRRARLCPLPAPGEGAALLDTLAEEFAADTDSTLTPYFQPDFRHDPRVEWLAELLRGLGTDKVLLICRTQRKVAALEAALRQRITVKIGVFHEGLSLVQRDRNAAWFAEEDGARLLICSEIGSEGRNFQFAHQLVMFDLPLDPELLEQRIGRLDRIGQSSEITIHAPYVVGSCQEVLVRWYQEGLGSFERNRPGGRELLERFGARVLGLAEEFHEAGPAAGAELDRLIAETRRAGDELHERLEHGRDRLLEWNSFRAEAAASLVRDIRGQDNDAALDEFLVAVLDHYSIHVEELAPRTFRLGSAGVFADSFPGLPAQGFSVTGDRSRALAREEVQFLTWDHPLVTGALDLLLGSEKGNSSFAKWPDAKAAGLYVEVVYLVECIAPPPLHLDRFLPPTPLRVLLDHRGKDLSATITAETLRRALKNGDGRALMERPEFREDLLPALLEAAEAVANARVPALVAAARAEMTAQLDREIARLRALQQINRSVRVEEVELLVRQKAALGRHLDGARLRLDAIRVIQRGPD
jgi:ATP-dependent helicase HepA